MAITLKDIAKMAGVGTATVERVINGRGGVRPQLAAKVLDAARRLQYRKTLPSLHRGIMRIEVLMLRPELSFIARMSHSFERLAASLDPSIAVHRTILSEVTPQEIAARISDPRFRRAALIVAVPDHPAVREALRAEQDKGVVIIQLISPVEALQTDYVGIDNQAAGRMAGLLMTGMQRSAGSVVALFHSQAYAVHRARIQGFSHFMAKPEAAHLNFSLAAFTYDNDQEAAKIVSSLIRSTPDLVGVYSTGGDYGPLCEMLRRTPQETPLCLIGHELTAQNAAAIRDGTITAIIDQTPEAQARRSLDLALYRLGLLDTAVDTSPIRFITITAENL
ncbi:MAG: LacI family DNA-binding transcriptional regulator [Alphaproteobacteria bacterium]|nr:LacI family DNA-binding transcriptional regulator [Alphaproteobacteria bacterium]